MSAQLRVAFLLTVFSINLIRGFTWTMRSKTPLSTHHNELKLTVHKDSRHPHKPGIYYESGGSAHNKVLKFSRLHKCFPPRYSGLNFKIITTRTSPFYPIDIFLTPVSFADTRYFGRSNHPPIADIRIAIRSFQV